MKYIKKFENVNKDSSIKSIKLFFDKLSIIVKDYLNIDLILDLNSINSSGGGTPVVYFLFKNDISSSIFVSFFILNAGIQIIFNEYASDNGLFDFLFSIIGEYDEEKESGFMIDYKELDNISNILVNEFELWNSCQKYKI